MAVTLFWAARTRASRTLWLLEELGIEYSIQRVDLFSLDSSSHRGFRAASPLGKVPAIIDGPVSLWDSAPISLYLSDRYGLGTLAPNPVDPTRAEYLFWSVFVPTFLEPAYAEHVRGIHPDRYSSGWGDWASAISLLENRFKHQQWLAGANFTSADILVGSALAFLEGQGLLGSQLSILEYLSRCLARSGWVAACEREERDFSTREVTSG